MPPPSADRPSQVPWPPLLLIGAVAGPLLLGIAWPLPWPGLDDLPARIVGMSIGVGGICLILWAMVSLHRAGTTILPNQGAEQLVTSGPFKRFRNPIYLGDVMVLLGAAELTKNIWFVVGAFIFAILVTRLAIFPEERHLEARFGDDYLAYKARSRRWI